MRRRGIPPAFTLFELTAVLTLMGLLLAIAAPRVVAMRDAAAVHAAVTDAAATFSLARRTAIARRGPVAVVIDTSSGVLIVRSIGGIVAQRAMRPSYGVRLGSNRDSVVYDAKGLGYGLSNLTLTIRRGWFVDSLTMSRLGRLR
jgi:Tfp pilus assembly protein FimT